MKPFSSILLASTFTSLSAAYGFKPDKQRIDVTGEHAFIQPDLSKDYRGPCPGLNALANHGYIPRNGVASIDQIVAAAMEIFGLSENQAEAAAIYSTPFTASPDLKNVSIGGPLQSSDVEPDPSVHLKISPQGLDFTHISVENDASPTRRDKYESGSRGNNHDLSLLLFKQLLAHQDGIDSHRVNYGIAVLAHHRYDRIQTSLKQNPKFFLQPFNGCFLQGNKYALIHRAFANHSVEHPMGRLDRQTLMSFYGVEESGWFKRLRYNKGGERIPDIWYRRPRDSPYGLTNATDDLLEMATYHQEFLSQYCAGGNLPKRHVWSKPKYAAIDTSKLTNGTYSNEALRNGYNVSCLGLVTSTWTAGWWLENYYGNFTRMVVTRLLGKLRPLVEELGCKGVGMVDRGLFEVFPGFNESLKVPEE